MAEVNCPTLNGYDAGEQCLENLAGMTEVMYVFEIADLETPLTLTGNVYSTPTFKTGKGLKKYDLKEEAQKHSSEGQGKRKGFINKITTVIDEVSAKTGLESRGLNNLNLGIIVPDSNGESVILYDKYKKVHASSFTSDTGAAASDDRVTTIEWQIGPVYYNHMVVTEPADGWDSLIAQ